MFTFKSKEESKKTKLKESMLPEILSEKEMKTILQYMKTRKWIKTRDRIFIYLMAASGLRASEVIDIKIENIRADENKMKIIGKRSKWRWVNLPDVTLTLIEQYFEETEDYADSEYLFTNPDGTKHQRWLVHNRVKDICTRAGYPKVYPHMLRHTYATNLLNNGVSLLGIRDALGHSDISITTIYAKLAVDDRISETNSKLSYLN